MKFTILVSCFLLSTLVYAKDPSVEELNPKNKLLLINNFIHECWSESGLLEKVTSDSSDQISVCKSKGLLTSPPLLKKETSKLQKLISVTCWDEFGTKKVVDTFDSPSKACEQNELLDSKPISLNCEPINGKTFIENYYGDEIKYTEIEYTCGNNKLSAKRKSVTCKGNLVGKLKECLESRFKLSDWKQQVLDRKAKADDETRRIKKEILDDATR